MKMQKVFILSVTLIECLKPLVVTIYFFNLNVEHIANMGQILDRGLMVLIDSRLVTSMC